MVNDKSQDPSAKLMKWLICTIEPILEKNASTYLSKIGLSEVSKDVMPPVAPKAKNCVQLEFSRIVSIILF